MYAVCLVSVIHSTYFHPAIEGYRRRVCLEGSLIEFRELGEGGALTLWCLWFPVFGGVTSYLEVK